jgi:hypothetical protein
MAAVAVALQSAVDDSIVTTMSVSQAAAVTVTLSFRCSSTADADAASSSAPSCCWHRFLLPPPPASLLLLLPCSPRRARGPGSIGTGAMRMKRRRRDEDSEEELKTSPQSRQEDERRSGSEEEEQEDERAERSGSSSPPAQWEIAGIIACRQQRGGDFFLIRWKGFSSKSAAGQQEGSSGDAQPRCCPAAHSGGCASALCPLCPRVY